MSALALVRLVIDAGGGYSLASLVTATAIISATIGQPLLARLIDCTGRHRTVLLVAALASTVAFLAAGALAEGPPVAIVMAAAVAGFATPPIEPTLRSLWPTLFTEPKHLASAYAVDAGAQEVAFIVGPLITATGIALFGAAGNIGLMAVLGLVGTVAYALRPEITSTSHPRSSRRAGHGSPLRSPSFRRLLIAAVAAAVPVGSFTITATGVAEAASWDALSPFALALNATGALIGALLVARFPLPLKAMWIRPLGLAFALLYLPTAATTLPGAYWLSAALLSGLALPPLLTQMFAHTPQTVSASNETEANAWVVSGFSLGIAAGTLLGGTLVGTFGLAGLAETMTAAVLIAALGALQAAPSALDSRR